jgi:transcriptional regulator with XRE-family HTH domain
MELIEMATKKIASGAAEPESSTTLGTFLKKARQDVKMTLRDVEEATSKAVSNGYLSQLEGGKISKPSPHILLTLSNALSVDYKVLMERAGYLEPGTAQRATGEKHGRAATFAIENLTSEEEAKLLEYLSFVRSLKK